MFEFLKPKPKPQPVEIEQTGYIHVSPTINDLKAWTDHSLGVDEVVPDWGEYLPLGEEQGVKFKWGTQACVSYSAVHTIITQIHALVRMKRLPQETIDFLVDYGYMDRATNNVNFSRRFVAIMSNTTPNGNTFPNVGNAIRHYGLIPDSMFPFGGDSFYEYHNKELITRQMIETGKKFLEHFEIGYEWVFHNDNGQLAEHEEAILKDGIVRSPIQVSVPHPAYHAIMLFYFNSKVDKGTFDSYKPFINRKDWGEKISSGFRVVPTPIKGPFIFTKTLRRGSRGAEVKKLQERLSIQPVDGVFGPITHKAVVDYQSNNALLPDGIVGPKTRARLNGEIVEEKMGYSEKILKWAKAIERHEGYFAPGQISKYPNGTLAWLHKNPGNFKYVARYHKPMGIIPSKDGVWCTFPTYTDGFKFLCDFLYKRATVKSTNYYPEMTLFEFFSKYAPAVENDTLRYAKNVADWIGVTIDTPIKDLV